jgi:hypothetical protein
MPDNAIYYHIAYVAAAAIYSGYAITIYMRRRALSRQASKRSSG